MSNGLWMIFALLFHVLHLCSAKQSTASTTINKLCGDIIRPPEQSVRTVLSLPQNRTGHSLCCTAWKFGDGSGSGSCPHGSVPFTCASKDFVVIFCAFSPNINSTTSSNESKSNDGSTIYTIIKVIGIGVAILVSIVSLAVVTSRCLPRRQTGQPRDPEHGNGLLGFWMGLI